MSRIGRLPVTIPSGVQVEIDGRHHLDGGLVHSIPVGRALELGATRVFVLQVGRVEQPLTPPRRPWEVGVVAFEISRRHRYVHEMESIPDGVEVHVLQGERSLASDNKSLGRFKLDGIPPMMAGMPQIEISYDINANGILNVTAKEKSTNKEASITIQNTTTLSEDEVDRMVKDAEANAERDREAREHVEAKNTLDSLRVQAQRTVDESTADDDTKQPVKSAIAEAQSAIDADAPKSRLEELARELSEKVAALQQAAPPASEDGTQDGAQDGAKPQGQDDDVVDADFKPAS